MNRLLLTATLLLVAGLAACDDDTEARPSAPDMSALVAAYAAPHGRLSAEKLPALAEHTVRRMDNFFRLLPAVVRLIETVGSMSGDGEAEGGLRVLHQALSPTDAEAGGWGRLVRRCPGLGDGSERGSIDLYSLFNSDAGIEDVIWGTFDQCGLLDGAEALRYNGTFSVFAPALDLANAIVELDIEVLRDGVPEAGVLDFQLFEGGVIMQQQLEDELFMVGAFFGDDTVQLLVEDELGRWTCDLETRRCTFGGQELSF